MQRHLPIEILHNLAFHLLASHPLGPPTALLPLLLTSRAFHAALTHPAFLARVFRLKFDAGAISRRAFEPYDTDCADQLVVSCRVLKTLRRGDFMDASEREEPEAEDWLDAEGVLLAAYVMMLDNDGRNWAQLEWAGVEGYVRGYVRRRLWEGREGNEGWPKDSSPNACALWLMWMMETKQKLIAETPQERDALITLILPYVLLPARYPASEAPPNHFHLPLSSHNPHHQPPLTAPLQHGPYPLYLDPRAQLQPHFRARPPITPPLITVAAKLLFVARKEVFPIRIPPHLPEHAPAGGMTRADYGMLNRGATARLCRGARWDWGEGVARNGDGREVREASREWDEEWWRRCLCSDFRGRRPRFAPGEVYALGSMSGKWQGRVFMPQGNLFLQLLHNPIYPGVPDEDRPALFTEQSIGLIMKPIFLDIAEHHRICSCPPSSSPTSTSSSPSPSTAGCGIIPVPPPILITIRPSPSPSPEPAEIPTTNASLQPDAEASGSALSSHVSEALTLSKEPLKVAIDWSMSNAWFPGNLGGVTFRNVPGGGGNGGKREKVVFAVDWGTPDLNLKGVQGVCGVPSGPSSSSLSSSARSFSPPPSSPPSPSSSLPSSSSNPTASSSSAPEPEPQAPPPLNQQTYLYETYHPALPSSHDPAICPRCKEYEALKRAERARAEREARVALEGYMREFGRGSGRPSGDARRQAVGGEEEEDSEMEDLDLAGFDFDFGAIEREILNAASAPSASAPSAPSASASNPTAGATASASSAGDTSRSRSGKRRRSYSSSSRTSSGTVRPRKSGRSASGHHQHHRRDHRHGHASRSISQASPDSSSSSSSEDEEEASDDESDDESDEFYGSYGSDSEDELLIYGSDTHPPLSPSSPSSPPPPPAPPARPSAPPSPARASAPRALARPTAGAGNGASRGEGGAAGGAAGVGEGSGGQGQGGEEGMGEEQEDEREEGVFVGEWRIATSDPVRPTWGGPFVMSRRPPRDAEVPVAVPAAPSAAAPSAGTAPGASAGAAAGTGAAAGAGAGTGATATASAGAVASAGAGAVAAAPGT
ncbi:hypothetical protein B0H34DRAFT_669736 [Crassisporium funariophilum]|nr:hypothetical protein B0H34DRAFT_669736 [Crassisporium funariophilum]